MVTLWNSLIQVVMKLLKIVPGAIGRVVAGVAVTVSDGNYGFIQVSGRHTAVKMMAVLLLVMF